MTTNTEPKLTEVIIDGIDVTLFTRTWEFIDELNETITSINITTSSRVDTILTINDDSLIGSSVTVKRGATLATEEFIFEGEIRKISFDNSNVVFFCKDKLFEGVRSEVTKSWDSNIDASAGIISEIFIDLWTTYTGLTADVTSVQDSGTINVLSKFIANHADVFAKGQELIDFIDWQQYYNPAQGKVYCEPKGFVSNTDILEVGVNITIPPVWKIDSSRLNNKLTIIGAEQLVETNENFSGDGSETTFTLDSTPISVKVFYSVAKDYSSVEPVNDDLLLGGDTGTSGTFNYRVDSDNKEIIFESESIPDSGTNNIRIQYSKKLPIPIVGSSSVSISTYGLHQKTIFRPDLIKQVDAEEFLKTQLSKFNEPFINSTLKVSRTTDMTSGQTLRIIDSDNSIDRYLLISKIKKVYPYTTDEVTVGDEAWKTAEWFNNVNKRIRKLEEELGKNQDLLLQIIDVERTIAYDRRYIKLQKDDLTGNIVLIWNSVPFGQWNSFKWGPGAARVTTIEAIVQGNNTYKEYLYDNDFIDESTSTATLNTTNRVVTF